MDRYTVYHSTGKRDGDAGFADLTKAQQEFDSQCARADVCEVELIDNVNPDTPVIMQRYSAADQEK